MNGKQLKNSILQWAIQGKLVSQDPNDEPASVLLERIRAEKAKLIKEKKIKKDKNESIIYRGDDNSYYEKFLATGEVKCIDEEIPFDLPFGWEWCRMGSIGDWGAGATPAKFFSGNYQAMLTVDKSEVVSKTENELLDIGYDLVFDDLFVPVLFAFSHILQINHFEHILILERQYRFYGINGFGQHLKEVARQRSAI